MKNVLVLFKLPASFQIENLADTSVNEDVEQQTSGAIRIKYVSFDLHE